MMTRYLRRLRGCAVLVVVFEMKGLRGWSCECLVRGRVVLVAMVVVVVMVVVVALAALMLDHMGVRFTRLKRRGVLLLRT